ncbi:DNA repair protein RadA [Jiulongibacter sediminis]|uniref:DNA repair protein RadA n=1 Tax=Jiulongibacter sediminis TaxID=1605367 RepID=UPI0026ED1A5A|nr:DNA repair protein RadA [Jiulongibacter sediminis]
MAKAKTAYFCQNCGYNSPKWLGKCPSCNQWNSLVEELIASDEQDKGSWRFGSNNVKPKAKPKTINEITTAERYRIHTNDEEFDRVLGGGLVPGSLILIGGEPGIGKSTLMLQLALSLKDYNVLYISGEESEQQLKMRAQRLKHQNDRCYILTETATDAIFKQIELMEPDVIIVDSIQTMVSPLIESGAGSVSQIKECAAEFMTFAKESDVPVLMIGHITKEGSLAGPKVLEHMVDTVLTFEGDRYMAYRLLRTSKNRFGSTSELGIYEMLADGLREVSNPSEILISERTEQISGISIASMMEGNRPLNVEIQSLVSTANYGTPQRTSNGFDNRRLQMLLAVLEKRGGFRLGTQDVFLNVAGGLKVEDPAIDLAVCVAVASSYEDLPVPSSSCFAAEVGLGGEIRAVSRIEGRISEAEKLGFKRIFISENNLKGLDKSKFKIQIFSAEKLEQVFMELFG